MLRSKGPEHGKPKSLSADCFYMCFLRSFSASATTASWPTGTDSRNWRTVESCWTCRRRNHRRWTVLRIIVSAMKNSAAVRCGSAQSVTKVACWRLRSCPEITAGRQRSRIPHDEEDCYEMQIKLLRASLAEPSGRSSVCAGIMSESLQGKHALRRRTDSLL